MLMCRCLRYVQRCRRPSDAWLNINYGLPQKWVEMSGLWDIIYTVWVSVLLVFSLLWFCFWSQFTSLDSKIKIIPTVFFDHMVAPWCLTRFYYNLQICDVFILVILWTLGARMSLEAINRSRGGTFMRSDGPTDLPLDGEISKEEMRILKVCFHSNSNNLMKNFKLVKCSIYTDIRVSTHLSFDDV